MKDADFCPLCGKEKGMFIKGLCMDCFLKKHSPIDIPEELEFEQCVSCAKIKVAGKMAELSDEVLAAVVEKKVKAKDLTCREINVSIQEGSAKVVVKGILDGVPLLFEKAVELKPKKVHCDACMRLSSNYHEAIIQLRCTNKKLLAKALPALINAVDSQHKKNSLAMVTDVSKKKNGFDLKVGSKKAAQIAATQMQRSFNAEIKVSTKLLGRDKKGKEKTPFLKEIMYKDAKKSKKTGNETSN